MKKLILKALAVSLILDLSGCSADPKDTLESNLEKYTNCTTSGDYQCVADLTDPDLVQSMGGKEGLEKAMKASGVNITSIKINNISPIKKDGKIMSSNITVSEVANVNGEKMTINGTIIAISKDNGSSWYFKTQE